MCEIYHEEIAHRIVQILSDQGASDRDMARIGKLIWAQSQSVDLGDGVFRMAESLIEHAEEARAIDMQVFNNGVVVCHMGFGGMPAFTEWIDETYPYGRRRERLEECSSWLNALSTDELNEFDDIDVTSDDWKVVVTYE